MGSEMTLWLVAREVAEICGSGSVAVEQVSAEGGPTLRIYGCASEPIEVRTKDSDWRLSLDDFSDTILAPHIKRGEPGTLTKKDEEALLAGRSMMYICHLTRYPKHAQSRVTAHAHTHLEQPVQFGGGAVSRRSPPQD